MQLAQPAKALPSEPKKRCSLTPRSSGAPTACHQAPATGPVYILRGRGLASCRRAPLSSNVRQHNQAVAARNASKVKRAARVHPMSEDTTHVPNSQMALRAGAASIYLLVGLVIGIVVAIAVLALRGEQTSPSFASIAFGVSGVLAVSAALFPSTALAALAPLANFAWGVINGSLAPESVTQSERGVGAVNQWLFWLGVAVGCALLLAWLLT